MKLSFRWFGIDDPVKLEHIRQIPAVSTVGAQVNAEELGELLSEKKISQFSEIIKKNGMEFEIFENLPIHSSIKLGLPERDHYIDNYTKNIQILADSGIKVITYNFRPIFRWARTDINKQLIDGSSVSVFMRKDAHKIDPFKNNSATSQWHRDNSEYVYYKQLTTDLTLNGYYTKESTERLLKHRQEYLDVGREGIWNNLKYFLEQIIPIAERCNIKMAQHPDDPPWDMFGVPRLLVNEEAIDRLLSCYDSPSNSLLFCSGTLGSNENNDVAYLAKKYLKMNRVSYAHIRNINLVPGGLEECAHYSECGSIDMVELLKAFSDNKFDGYIRSDHGRMIWGKEGTPVNGIYDRALGAQYILGIWETLNKLNKE